MKTMNMISRRNFLKAALGAAAVSAFSLTGCGGSASSAASGTASSAAASSAAASAEAGQTFKVGIVNYVDHASLNQIVASVESRLDEVGKEKGVTFDYADYYANAQADQTNLNQIGADLVADDVDVIVAVATPTAATMLASVEDTDIPVVYSAVTDPVSAGFDGEEVHADSKCRQKFAVQAQAVGFTALLFLGQQQYPAQHRGNNNDNVGNGQPPRLWHSHGQNTHNQHQHGGHDVQTVKPLGRIRPPRQQEGQHDTRRRVKHLGVGKNACILPVLQADV